MSFLREFKEFAIKGNAIDLAVGVVIGAAFGKIVSSLVGDVIMPPLGLLIGGVDFTQFAITLKEATDGKPAVILAYGKFIQVMFDFTIIAFAIFLMVKGINRLKRVEPPKKGDPAPAIPEDIRLLTEIRDLLKKK